MMNILLAEAHRDAERFMAEHPEHAGRTPITPRGCSGVVGTRVASIVTTPSFDALRATGRGWGAYAEKVALTCERSLRKTT
jgi:hypothetical protein